MNIIIINLIIVNLGHLFSGAQVDERSVSDGSTALIAAVRKGSISCVQLLLSLGADPNVQDEAQNTALHIAVLASRGNIDETNLHDLRDIISELLEAGVDAEKVNIEGQTAVQIAQEENNATILYALGIW